MALFLATQCVAQVTSPNLAAADELSRSSLEKQVSADEGQSSKSISILHQKEGLAKQPQIIRPKLIERPHLMPVEKKRIGATRRAPIHERTDALRNAVQELGPDHPKVASLRQQIEGEEQTSSESQVRLRNELRELEEEIRAIARSNSLKG